MPFQCRNPTHKSPSYAFDTDERAYFHYSQKKERRKRKAADKSTWQRPSLRELEQPPRRAACTGPFQLANPAHARLQRGENGREKSSNFVHPTEPTAHGR